jgi:hypothetical protein
MSILRAVTTNVFCLALMGAAFSTGAKADQWSQKTVLTFSGPVEIPGVHLKGWGILPAGTYVFKLLDSQSDRHIVQIFNKDETQVIATILAIPNYRLKATGKTVVTFRERPAGEPEAIRAWFYPGENFGQEFVYPKLRASALHGCRSTGGSRSSDQVGGRGSSRATEAGAGHGDSAHRRRSGTCPGDGPGAGAGSGATNAASHG